MSRAFLHLCERLGLATTSGVRPGPDAAPESGDPSRLSAPARAVDRLPAVAAMREQVRLLEAQVEGLMDLVRRSNARADRRMRRCA